MFPNRNLNQKAVYWSNPTPNGYGGFDYDDPIELDCRWVERTQVVTDSKGHEIVSRASVQVNYDLDEQGLLWLGELDDLDSAGYENPETISDAYVIKRFDKTPTIKADAYFRIAYL